MTEQQEPPECPSCRFEGVDPPEPCPGGQELYYDDTPCHCCDVCRDRCARDV